MTSDDEWMALALDEARRAGEAGEVPVGAVLVRNGVVIATGRNAPLAQHDPSAHAEVAALRAGALALRNYRLDGCELFVTLEPCAMCAGAILHARLDRIVIGADDPKTGAAGSVVDLFAVPRLNHRTRVTRGVRAESSAALLQEFFQARRVAVRRSASPLRDDALRTSADRFTVLPDFDIEPQYVDDLPTLGGLRLAYVDHGAVDAPTLVCLHGPGEWSYVFRHLAVQPGVRVLAPDLIGHGRSDKPKREAVHRPDWHRDTVVDWLDRLDPAPFVLVHSAAGAALARSVGGARRALGVLEAPDGPVSATDAWQAPFPDRGHAAALRALGTVGTARSGPDRPQAADLVQRAMGYFAP